MKKLNENFNRITNYKPSYVKEDKRVIWENNEYFDKILNLIKSGQSDNINLAFELAEGMGLKDELLTFINREDQLGWFEGNNAIDQEWLIKNLGKKTQMFRLEEPVRLGALSYFQKAERLSLGKVIVNKLDEDIRKLGNLKIFSISESNLTEIPKVIGELKQLTSLGFNLNSITSIPESMTGLPNLRALEMEGNQLETLPESFGNLKNLDYISLAYNKLTELPESMGNLKKLQTIQLSNNKLTHLPQSMYNLENVEDLWLANNNFSQTEKGKIWVNFSNSYVEL